MNDLQEIQRFWPKAKEFDVFGPLYVAKPFGATSFVIMECADGTFLAKRRKTAWSFTGPTIAAAMAAAGFAQRPIGRYRETFNQYADRLNDKAIRHRAWHDRRYRDKPILPLFDACKRHDDGTRLWPVFLESRQRPRKGVRLGKHGRRLALAASIGEALDLVRQKRQDRREMGNG